MPSSAVYEAAIRYRAALLVRERRAATSLVQYYGEVYGRLSAEIGALLREIEAQRAAGETISAGRLMRLDRMQAIQRQTAEELERYAVFADDVVQNGKRWAIAAGEREAFDLVQLSFPRGAVSVTPYRMPREAAEALIGTLQDGAPLRSLLLRYGKDAAQGMGESLVNGVVAGWNPRKVAQEMRKAFGTALNESLLLARTEQLRAHRTAALETYKANGNIVKGWVRSASKDDRTCMACLLLDGKKYDLEHEMDDHPAGRCALLPDVVTFAELGIDAPEPQFNPESGREWFERQPEAVQRQMMSHISKDAYDAWKAGLFDLDDIPQHNHSDTWGDSWTEKPMYKLLGLDAPQRDYYDTTTEMMGANLERAFKDAGL
jgi:SPP1 gp7 family putative phage head morphogenesis protein